MTDGAAGLIEARRAYTHGRVAALQEALAANGVTDDKLRRACMYATGSVGRGEASRHSDLDVFLLDLGAASGEPRERRLGNIEQTELKADIIRATRAADYPEFSGDGEYLVVHSMADVQRLLGTRDDDARNLFTARLLLLLEGRCLANADVYAEAISNVVASYWRDYAGHEDDFIPIMLANDIMRFWKTLCLNYEAKRNQGPAAGTDEQIWRAKRKLENVKLGFSRLWVCHTTLAYLVWKSSKGPVTAADAIDMSALSPSERLAALAAGSPGSRLSGLVDEVLQAYSWFLTAMDRPKDALLEWILEPDVQAEARQRSHAFGGLIYDMICEANAGGSLLRYIVV